MPARSTTPVRIAVRSARRTSGRAVAALADGLLAGLALAGPARVARLGPDRGRRDFLLEVDAQDSIGSPGYAAAAWGLVHRLQDTGDLTRVEADVPVPAYAPGDNGVGAFGGGDCAADPASAPGDWALQTMNVPQALDLMDPAVRGGVGVRVGHPDSGFSDHPALGLASVDTATDWDVIDGDPDASDPLRPPRRTFFNPLPNPGHGTSTASVLLGDGEGAFRGVAQGAVLVPYRATESVVQLFDSDVADAVRRARGAGCHVVSMSLGGTGFFGLREAIQEAVDGGMIVMAAAGNQVGVVTAPASYDNCLAVAATGTGDVPWSGSSRGSAVDVSAPGSCVWAALFDWQVDPPGRIVGRSHGTSYAVAHLAGVAALWLAHHGHQALCDTYGRGRVQAVFLHVLNTPGVCARPAGWDDAFGAGRVDAEAVLGLPLPDPADVGGVGAFGAGAAEDPVSRIAALTDTDPAGVRAWLERKLGTTDLDARIRRYGGELAYLLLADPSFRADLTMPGLGAFRAEPPEGASEQLRALLSGG
ncbi:MAG: S8 family serine peptidase [Pseudonocardia sp.]